MSKTPAGSGGEGFLQEQAQQTVAQGGVRGGVKVDAQDLVQMRDKVRLQRLAWPRAVWAIPAMHSMHSVHSAGTRHIQPSL